MPENTDALRPDFPAFLLQFNEQANFALLDTDPGISDIILDPFGVDIGVGNGLYTQMVSPFDGSLTASGWNYFGEVPIAGRPIGENHNDWAAGGAGSDTLVGDSPDDLSCPPAEGDPDKGDNTYATQSNDVLYGDSGFFLDPDDLQSVIDTNPRMKGYDNQQIDITIADYDLVNVPLFQQQIALGLLPNLAGGGDELIGGRGNDTIFGQIGNDTLDGGGGSDYLFGGRDDDLMDGDFLGNERDGNNDFGGNAGVFALDSPDVIDGFLPAAILYDTADYRPDGDACDEPDEGDFMFGGRGKDLMYGGDDGFGFDIGCVDDEPVKDGDWMRGGGGRDTMNGEAGFDTMYGGACNDEMRGSYHYDLMDGGLGSDLMFGGTDGSGGGDEDSADCFSPGGFCESRFSYDGTGDTMFGGRGLDTMYGGRGDDLMFGGKHNDQMYGGDDDDRMDGQKGNDFMSGGSGWDDMLGNGGFDSMNGDSGDDFMDGASKDDLMGGGSGRDYMFGGTGDDVMHGDGTIEFLDGPGGSAVVDAWGNPVVTDFANMVSNDFDGQGDYMHGGRGCDIMFGNGGDDCMKGDEGRDQTWGGDGNDTLDGGTGIDTMVGGDGDDVIYFNGNADPDYQNGNVDAFESSLLSEDFDMDVPSGPATRQVREQAWGDDIDGSGSPPGSGDDTFVYKVTYEEFVDGIDGEDILGLAGGDFYSTANGDSGFVAINDFEKSVFDQDGNKLSGDVLQLCIDGEITECCVDIDVNNPNFGDYEEINARLIDGLSSSDTGQMGIRVVDMGPVGGGTLIIFDDTVPNAQDGPEPEANLNESIFLKGVTGWFNGGPYQDLQGLYDAGYDIRIANDATAGWDGLVDCEPPDCCDNIDPFGSVA